MLNELLGINEEKRMEEGEGMQFKLCQMFTSIVQARARARYHPSEHAVTSCL